MGLIGIQMVRRATPVSTLVNSPANDDPCCIEPISPTGHLLAQTLNGRLGLDAGACAAFAEQVMATNPTGRHPRDRPE